MSVIFKGLCLAVTVSAAMHSPFIQASKIRLPAHIDSFLAKAFPG
jgi:hypothetical protein